MSRDQSALNLAFRNSVVSMVYSPSLVPMCLCVYDNPVRLLSIYMAVVERWSHEREVRGSLPDSVIAKTL